MANKPISEVISSRYKKLTRESDVDLYIDLRIHKKDWESVFPWYVLRLRELEEAELRRLGYDIKISLAKSLASNFLVLITEKTETTPAEMFISHLSDLAQDEGVPIERKVTSVPRASVKDGDRKAMRVVIEGGAIESIGAELGDRLDLYVVPTTPEREGYLRLVRRKKLR